MSADEETIQDRPYPFEIKTRIMQLVGMAIATPTDVADIHVNTQPAWGSLEVSIWVGGYSDKKHPGSFSQTVYLTHSTIPNVIKTLDELIQKLNAAAADGRKVKAQRLRDEAAALIAKATEIENVANTEAELAKA